MSEHEGMWAYHGYRGWSVVCSCGWESPKFWHRPDADQALQMHITREKHREDTRTV